MRVLITILVILLLFVGAPSYLLYVIYFYETVDSGRSNTITYAVKWAIWDHLYLDGKNKDTRQPLNSYHTNLEGPRGLYCTVDEFHNPKLPFGSCSYVGANSLEQTEACSFGRYFRSCVAISVETTLYNDPEFHRIFESVMDDPCPRIPGKNKHEFGCRGKKGPITFHIVVRLRDYDPVLTEYKTVSEIVYKHR